MMGSSGGRARRHPGLRTTVRTATGWALATCLLAAAAPARAQSVQKCVAADGHVSFTSGACGAGERLEATYEAVPERVPARSAVAPRGSAEARTQRRSMQDRPAARAPRTHARPALAPDRCQAARDRRERTLARVGLKRTFDLLRRLDDEVRAACR